MDKTSNLEQNPPLQQTAVMCCASCFKEIPENHFERRANHDNEHCPNCGNDFMGSKWFSAPIPKDKIEKIRAVLLA
jgi:NMD protein affecting ribosome stability and mRNA decay